MVLSLILLFGALVDAAQAEPLWLDREFHHLRLAEAREWSEFPQRPDATRWEAKFESHVNDEAWTLRLRQQDIKQVWNVLLNGKSISRLIQDENDQVVYLTIPPGAIADGDNTLAIEQKTGRKPKPDDIRVGEIFIDRRPREDALHECVVEVAVVDGTTRKRLPSRLTIVNEQGTLHAVGAVSDDHLAVRNGVVYTSTGNARFGLPAGEYRIYAGRGFEYSVDHIDIRVSEGDMVKRTLAITRQVDTSGYVACDTHVHSRTHSGHGDATVQERMITLAAEGVELPIATDHNIHIDHNPFARAADVRQHFTPVIGNEVTTDTGHFNVFPIEAEAATPDAKLTDWNDIFNSIYSIPGVKIAILNHARDIHRGVRPFGPSRFNPVAAESLVDGAMRFNAMEVINSGATQSDILQLTHDWMALLNRGLNVTPVGSSDSHDVSRYIVGQGRTYIRCDDRDPGNIDVDQAVNNFLQGRVMVSYGLMAEIRVDGKYGPGEMCPVSSDEINVRVRVLGPDWVTAQRVALYANGVLTHEADIAVDDAGDLPPGVLWQGEWNIPRARHDVFLVAVATGGGIDELYWNTAKPYQPNSPDWRAQTLGISGAVWLDCDSDNRKSSARQYAERLMHQSKGNLKEMLRLLADYDRAVAAQTAYLYHQTGASLLADDFQAALRTAADETKAGFHLYIDAWRTCEQARVVD